MRNVLEFVSDTCGEGAGEALLTLFYIYSIFEDMLFWDLEAKAILCQIRMEWGLEGLLFAFHVSQYSSNLFSLSDAHSLPFADSLFCNKPTLKGKVQWSMNLPAHWQDVGGICSTRGKLKSHQENLETPQWQHPRSGSHQGPWIWVEIALTTALLLSLPLI